MEDEYIAPTWKEQMSYDIEALSDTGRSILEFSLNTALKGLHAAAYTGGLVSALGDWAARAYDFVGPDEHGYTWRDLNPIDDIKENHNNFSKKAFIGDP